jgi:DNA-binding MurR/RpiR family transcriptional regulator
VSSSATPATLDDLVTKLCIIRTQMPERLRTIADEVIERPRDIALMSISEAAKSFNTSPSTFVRFSKVLGFDGFSSMQKMLRRNVLSGGDGYRERLKSMATDGRRHDIDYLFDALSVANIRALEEARVKTNMSALGRMVDALRRSRLIGVAGVRRAFPLAAYLHYGLLRLELASLLIDGVGGMSDRQLAAFGDKDSLVVLSFAPYAAEMVALAEEATGRGIALFAITDGQESPFATLARESVFATEGTINDIRAIAVTSTVIQTIFVALGLAVESEKQERD